MSSEFEVITLAEWHAQGVQRFGDDVDKWLFVCPSCGLKQSRADWVKLGMNKRTVDSLVGYSCIGRWKHPLGAVSAFEPPNGKGCKYLGGLTPNISPITVVISTEPQEERPTFGWA